MSINNSDITQRVENSTVDGGILANKGDKNVQVHGEGNVVTYNQTEILQISREEITSRKLITTSPYKGLKAFESRDKELFFGRDNFITTLVNELEQTNLILLLGASGSGKSSVVRAGLIPWLEKKYGTKFTNLIFTPDADPFDSFYASLLSKYSQAEAKVAREVKADTLVRVANNLKQSDEFWFIFIDQFEELFTISDENKRREFINGLMKLSKAKLPNLEIMATMRADFLERLSDFPQLVETTQKHRPMIVEMQSSELRLAIEQPAAYHGVVFEADLVDKIIAEVKGQAGCLPLLQYTLNLVWEDEVRTGSINDRTLNIETYQSLGGVKGALQQHVNTIYEKLSPSEKFASQRIFLKLVGIGENAESGIEWKPVRRRAMLSEFGDNERDVLLKLVNENLLVSDVDLSVNSEKKGLFGFSKPEKSNSTIEITHEILLTSWDKLHYWIQKNRQGIALRNRLYEDVKRWKDKKPEDELWTGSKLEQILELKKDDNFNQVLGGFNKSANQFIDASVGLRDRQLRRARKNTVIGFTLAGLASVASIFAFFQQKEAQRQSIISMTSITQNVESLFLNNNQIDAIVEAIKAKKKLDNLWIGKDSVSARVLSSLAGAVHYNQEGWREHLRLKGADIIFSPKARLLATIDNDVVRLWDTKTGKQSRILKGHKDKVQNAVFSPDGKQIATASKDKTARLWDVSTGKQLKTLKGHENEIYRIEFSPNGKKIATASVDKTARLWDVSSGKLLHTLSGHKEAVYIVKFSPKDKRIVTASADKTARLWDVDTGEQLQIFEEHKKSLMSVEFSPDGEKIATASTDETARLWDVNTGEQLKIFEGHEKPLTSVKFSPDGEKVVTVSTDTTARLWDVDTGKQSQIFKGHKGKLRSVRFSPKDEQIATTSDDRTVRVWDISTGKQLQALEGHEGKIYRIEFSEDGEQIATASDDGTARVWDVSAVKKLQIVVEHKKPIYNVVFSPNGMRIATASEDETARLWNAQTGEYLRTLEGHTDSVSSVDFSPDGMKLVTSSDDETARLWDVATGKHLKTLKGHKDSLSDVVFSPNGMRIATASEDNTARIWDATTGKLLRTLKGHKSSVSSVDFSPNSMLVITGSHDETVRIWDIKTGKQQTLKGHEGSLYDVAFNPNGKQLATASFDETVRLWDAKTGKHLQTLRGNKGSIRKLAFNSDGKLLVSGSQDSMIRLWDAKTGKRLQTLRGHKGSVYGVAFSPNGKQIATGSEDGTLRLWKIGDIDEMLAISCDWVRHYLESKPEDDEDRNLCDGVGE